MKSNRHRATIYYLTLSIIMLVVLLLVGLAITARNWAEGSDTPTSSTGVPSINNQIGTEPEREFEIGDIARFVVGGGAVHQGPIIAHQLTPDNQWVYDIRFPATSGAEGSIWQDLEENRILLVTEDTQIYQPEVVGLPVKLLDLITQEKWGEGIVAAVDPTTGEYDILTSDCVIIRPPQGLQVVLVNNLVEPLKCTNEFITCPTPTPDRDKDRSKDDDRDKDKDEPTPTPTLTPTPEPTATAYPYPTPYPTTTPAPTATPYPTYAPTTTPYPEPTVTPTPTPAPTATPTPEPSTPTPTPTATPTPEPETPTPEPTPTEEPTEESTEEPDGTDGVTGSDAVEP
jgi:hypothetical protein